MVNQGCLIKNLSESESLPQIGNRYENITQLTPVLRKTGGGNEVNDEGKGEAVAIIAPRHQKMRKKERGTILDEFVELTGYNRRYASYVLRSHGKKVWINEKNSL
jgi:hypothetical protein